LSSRIPSTESARCSTGGRSERMASGSADAPIDASASRTAADASIQADIAGVSSAGRSVIQAGLAGAGAAGTDDGSEGTDVGAAGTDAGFEGTDAGSAAPRGDSPAVSGTPERNSAARYSAQRQAGSCWPATRRTRSSVQCQIATTGAGAVKEITRPGSSWSIGNALATEEAEVPHAASDARTLSGGEVASTSPAAGAPP